eukprot:TRINITY_DN30211_c0_g1_i1.p1 TRINITY_DN30211_c0_g1~~TRINITY_DN30211_c0_g1_i1.p1  ORF type:complete len:170 (+),score=35.69 TRINITY_DN30211_c0_g1_i1:156-665(+)
MGNTVEHCQRQGVAGGIAHIAPAQCSSQEQEEMLEQCRRSAAATAVFGPASQEEFDKIRDMVKAGARPPEEPTLDRRTFEVSLLRTGENWATLGLMVNPDVDPGHLVIDTVWKPSLVSEWNENVPEDLQVNVGDRVVAVNGRRGTGEEMTHWIQASGQGEELVLLVMIA